MVIRRTSNTAGVVLVMLAETLIGCQDRAAGGNHLSSVPGPEAIGHAREVLRLGRAEGSGPDVFGQVSFVAVDHQGHIYVADGMTQEIRVFDEDGRFARTVGGAGEGPGEFSGFTGMIFDETGAGWVWDPPQHRMSIFDSAGVFMRSMSRRWPTLAIPWPARFSGEGYLLDVATELRGLEPDKRVTKRFQHLSRVVRLDTLLQPLDSTPPIGKERTAFAGNFIVPFEGGVVMALDSDGSEWSTHGPEYRIIKTTAQGDTVGRFGVDAPLEPVTAAERDSVLASMHLSPSVPTMEESLIPASKPAVVRLVWLAPGWVGAFPELGEQTGRILDVFGPDGRLLERIDLGARLALTRGAPVASGGKLYGVTTDELDVPFVLMFDLGIDEIGGQR